MKVFSKLESVLRVEKLKANLICIGQICELNLYVNFICEKCSIVDNFGNYFFEGVGYVDNCYILS